MHRDIRWPIEEGVGEGGESRSRVEGGLESSGGRTKAPRSRGAARRLEESRIECNPVSRRIVLRTG